MNGRLAVYVLATTLEGTKSAFAQAQQLTEGLDAQIVLLVPRLSSFGDAFDPTGEQRSAIMGEQCRLTGAGGRDVSVLFYVGHRLQDIVHQMPARSSLIIVGGTKRTWWPSPEQRLAERLAVEGYSVLFVPA
jgi:hypothetical protein